MDNKIRNKNIFLAIVVLLVGFLLAGGTYAYLTRTVNVTNGNINAVTTCFDIDYMDTNQITGTLFPSANPSKGLSGMVSLKVNSSCDLNGIGTIYIHANSGTSTKFTTTAIAHCENPVTLESLPTYVNSNTCTSNNGIWVTNGKPLKYAIFDNSAGSGNPLDVGYFSSIGNDIAVYRTFMVTSTQVNYYLFLWLDGYLTDNTYTNLSFNGYISVSAIQDNPNSTFYLPNLYQRVEYIKGDSRIITEIVPANNRGIYARIKNGSVSSDSIPYVYFGSSNSYMNGLRFYTVMKNGNFLFGWNDNEYGSIAQNTTDINTIKLNYLNNRNLEFNDQIIATNIPNLATTTFPLHIFGLNRGGSSANPSVLYELYEFKVSEKNNVIADLVPCYRKGDNIVGLYDIRNRIFYTKTSGDSFTKGPDVN